MFLAGFCVDPDGIVYDLVPENQRNATAFFLACEGSCPLKFAAPTKTPRELEDYWDAICVPTHGLSAGDSAQRQLLADNLMDAYEESNYYISCEMTAKGWDGTVHEGLCTHLIQGLYDVWVSLYVSTFFLFLTMIVCSLMYQYYRKEVKEFIDSDVRVAPGGDIELQAKH